MAKRSYELLEVGDRVISNEEFQGIPKGTRGRVILVNGFDWIRYRVLFETEQTNGTDKGSLHRHQLTVVNKSGEPIGAETTSDDSTSTIGM